MDRGQKGGNNGREESEKRGKDGGWGREGKGVDFIWNLVGSTLIPPFPSLFSLSLPFPLPPLHLSSLIPLPWSGGTL